MAKKPCPEEKSEMPFQVRLKEVQPRLDEAHTLSGIPKPDIVRMAVAAFLDAHDSPDAIIDAAIKYRSAQAAQRAGAPRRLTWTLSAASSPPCV